ncbi:uncharacterized protein EDB91DRAFT_1249951 [Suillus paluster]|uniref:uncharacterized protein n=1 Tax=Suillus paluster TaxID=48578 RepID=UPI001B8837A1|nr:uncharacterized protein EDB91DRAFT_1249951 [Suillus paluster]KAG1736650.1 hypothetical protein EDB91DRAFT_1249951 [Suillus paluster]
MITLYVAMIGLSIFSLIQASIGAVFYNINIILANLCIQVGVTAIYSILVAHRLLAMRRQMKQVMAQYDSSTYATVVLMVVESDGLYSVFAIILIVAFALHLNSVSTLCFLSIGSVQGIAQLFIILRVARGRGSSGYTRMVKLSCRSTHDHSILKVGIGHNRKIKRGTDS